MDVNSVLQNTRQYFQGVPSSSPASGELAPGASVGYNSPPVASTATSTATSATNPFPPYHQTFPQQSSWNSPNIGVNSQNEPANMYHSASSSAALVANNAVTAYSRNHPSPSVSAAYHNIYENAVRSSKMLPTNPMPPYVPQHNYLTPSITRVKESPSQDMYNMNSIVCQSNTNHGPNKKLKIRTSMLTNTTKSPSTSSSMLMYKQPTQPEESRYYNNRLAAASQPPLTSGSTVVSRLPSILPSSYGSTPTHQLHQRPTEQASPNHLNYPSRAQITEQRFDYHQQPQASYHAVRSTTSIEMIATVEAMPPVSKRDSPLDLSVKTIRQSADSTGHDEAEAAAAAAAAAFGHHFPGGGQQPLRLKGRHSHLPQLPFAPIPVAVSGARNPVVPFNGTHGSRAHYYPETAFNSLTNGQLVADNVSRMPVSEFRKEMTVSITYEQKEQILRTTQYSHQLYKHTTLDTEAQPRLPHLPPNHMLAIENDTLSPMQATAMSTNAATTPRKRRTTVKETAPPLKNPRISNDWRESIDKEIESRLNAYTAMKAREEEERQLILRNNEESSYQNNNAIIKHQEDGLLTANEPPRSSYSPSVQPELMKGSPTHQSTSSVSPWQHPQKGQHKLPVQPIQMHPLTQQWYPPSHQRLQQPYAYDNTQHKSNAHLPTFSKPYDNRGELKTQQKAENSVQEPLPPFQKIPLKSNFSPRLSNASNEEKLVETKEKEKSEISTAELALTLKKEKEEAQSRAALMASALTHPRIRTKAELKQVAPVDKSSKDKVSTDAKLPESAQNVVDRNGSQFVTENTKDNNNADMKSKLGADKLMLNSKSMSDKETSKPVEGKNFSPRKKLLTKNDESRANAKRNSSKTTVFEFRDSDSEPETSGVDLSKLNEMRKDRKIRSTSVSSGVSDQLSKEPSDDSKWLEACDELIQQFSSNNQKKRGRKKRMNEDVSEVWKKKQFKEEQSDSADDNERQDEKKISSISAHKIKKENRLSEEKAVELPAKVINIKKEKEEMQEKKLEERPNREVERDRKSERQPTSEIRGQRSNVSTTRIRIQNQLDDSSESEKNDTEDTNTEGESDEDEEDDEDDEDFEEAFKEKPKLKKAQAPKKIARKSKIKLRNKKVPISRATLKKKKKKKTITSKKLKKVDMKREKMRHMILRRMETRKSKIGATKNSKKAKAESASTDEPQPRMTRKMALRESLRENKKDGPVKEKVVSIGKSVKGKTSEKDDKKTKNKDVKFEKVDKQHKTEKVRPETRKQTREEKFKKKVKKKFADSKIVCEKNDEVTRRTLRSRNVVVSNDKPISKVKKDEIPQKKNPKFTPQQDGQKLKSPLKAKKESKNEDESSDTRKTANEKNDVVKDNHKNKDKEKVKYKEKATKGESKTESNPSWEEELFKYKYSLRMPVKLINISGPNNWPKTSGGHPSSLPDLDRNETDSDLLEGISKQKTPKKKNKDEAKFSNTKEFKDSVKYLQEKFDKKIEEKNQASDLTKLMMEKKMKTIPKSSDGPELLPTPSLDSFRSKLNSLTPKKENRKSKDTNKLDNEMEQDEVVEDSLIGYFRKETVEVFKDVFEKHNKIPNQFQTVILESRTRTQTKELKHHATLKQVFGCDRPASAPPVPDINELTDSSGNDAADARKAEAVESFTKTSTNGVLKPWHKNYAKIKYLMGVDEGADSDKDSRDFEESVDFLVDPEEDSKDTIEVEPENVVKKKSRTIRRKCRSSGFDYIRKKKKQKKEDDDEMLDDKDKKKLTTTARPTPESIEDIQNEIKSWVVNKGIGETVLHKAARLGYLDISSYCLEKLNCSPSPTDNAGYTPLHEACTRGHLRIAKMLLKYGADVSASARGGIRPLHEAVESGDIELVRLLLSYGADPLLSTYGGQTPLSLVKENQDDLKEFLLFYLADIQGNPSKPWYFNGVDDFDRELIGYDPLNDPPSPTCDETETLDFEMNDSSLPSLYRFKDEYDYWVLSTDLPARVRDAVTKRSHDQSPSQYVVRKINRSQFEENVYCVMLLENKHVFKSKTKSSLITMVKYNDKLLSTLNIQKISMTFS